MSNGGTKEYSQGCCFKLVHHIASLYCGSTFVHSHQICDLWWVTRKKIRERYTKEISQSKGWKCITCM